MTGNPYHIFPHCSSEFDDECLISNNAGEFYFLPPKLYSDFLNLKLETTSDLFDDLKSKFFLTDSSIENAKSMIDIRIRTKKKNTYSGVSLHMVVPTIRCNSKCVYCQVSSKNKAMPLRHSTDMSMNVAKKTVDLIFKSPSEYLKIEFQGGEPTLNFEIVEFIVKYAEAKAKRCNKNLEFVICTNLISINAKMLRFIKKHNIMISTSLDGPQHIHSANRPLPDGRDSFESFVENLELARSSGVNKISALLTVTSRNLFKLKEVVDEYIKLGFSSIFIRPINPFGRALENDTAKYSSDIFIQEYLKCIEYILEINKKGVYFIDEFISILARSILTPYNHGFVDLQSPSGAGTMCALYNYDGKIYASDEGRMLGEQGDFSFQLGTVNDRYDDIFKGKFVSRILEESCLENYEDCSSCSFMPFCGCDIVKDYVESGKLFQRKVNSISCQYVKPIFEKIFRIIKDDNEDLDIIWSWLR